MKPLTAIAILLTLLWCVPAMGAEGARERLSLDWGWRFHLGNAADPSRDFGYRMGTPFAKAGTAVGAAQPGFGDGGWRQVDLPHDWAVELDFDPDGDTELLQHGFKPVGWSKPATSVGWYRRSFDLPKSDLGKRLSIEFDGVFRDSIVWLNGHFLGRHLSGYTGFRYDISDVANYGGRNTLVVRVDATQYEGWFYEGAGIYRHTWLVKTAPLHVAPWGTYVTAIVQGAKALVTAETRVVNESDRETVVQLRSQIVDPQGRTVATTESLPVRLSPWTESVVRMKAELSRPQLWSLETPNRYRLLSRVERLGPIRLSQLPALLGAMQRDKTHFIRFNTLAIRPVTLFDEVETPFGIRTIRFDPNKGFFLNGKRVEIKGTCNHQDHAGVGSALPDRIQEYRIERLKAMGCNAIRTSHNAPTPELLDACDRLGMLVMDEHRMIGSSPEILEQLESLVRRDRNHPSVILWSIGNEENLEGTETGRRIALSMKRTVRQLDPARPVTFAGNNGGQFEGVNSVVDVRGWNYFVLGNIDAYHRQHPDQPMMGSEEASTLSTRGIYANDPQRGYMSAYDVNRPGWGSLAEQWWKFYAARPFLAGAFVWTGFDYRGEPTPYGWPCISSHFGILDTCGFPKDDFYYYQSWWTDKPMLHLLPHWNWPGREGQAIDVWCYSNCEQVELLLNGKSLGAKKMEPNGHLEWKVAYAPGTLEARGSRGGRVMVTEKVETTDPPAKILLVPDRTPIKADGEDVAMVTVSAQDAQGRTVPTADNEVQFAIEGNGRILGVGNGDPSSHEADRAVDQIQEQSLSTWRMNPVDSVENRPEVATDFDDSNWEQVSADDPVGAIKNENEAAIYRTTFDIEEEAIRSGRPRLTFARIDDLGWIYVNGRKIGETTDWDRSYTFDVAPYLQSGRNTVAVIVKNVGGYGGLARGVVLSTQQARQWERRAFNGLCLVIVQSTKQPGPIRLKATSPGLESAEITIQAVPAPLRPAVP